MEQRIFCAVLAAIAIICGTSCVSAKQVAGDTSTNDMVFAPQSSTKPTVSVAPTASGTENLLGDKLLEVFFAALPKSGVVHVTDSQGTSFQVDASDEAVSQIWDLLSEQNYAPLQATDDLFQGAHSSISLRYTTDQNYLIKLYGCDDDHPTYPGQTVIDLENHGGGEIGFQSAATGIVVFERVSEILARLRKTLSVVLDRDTTLLQTGSLVGNALTTWAQNGNRVMMAFSGNDGDYVQLFDADTGDLLGTTRVAQPITRIDMSREESGYDYQIFTASRVIYKNSRDPATEKQYALPTTVMPIAWEKSEGDFDVKYGKIVWTQSDGAYICQPDDSAVAQIISNDDLSTLAGDLAPQGTMKCVAPRLLNEAEQAVVPIAVENRLVGVVLVDLENGTKTGFFDVFGENYWSIDYPSKHNFAAASEKDVTLVDVTSGERKRYEFAFDEKSVWYSGDYKNFVVAEPQKDTLFNSFFVSARKPTDRSRPFLTVRGRGGFNVIGASERNLLLYIADDHQSSYQLIPIKSATS